MITELRIRGLGVIADAELDLGPGLTVLTGETGAGKTMVLTALGLLLGSRADAGTVRDDTGRAEVDGVLDVGTVPAVAARAVDAGASVDDDVLVVGRTVTAAGRSRTVLGGRTVPTSVLVELADDLVAVHGQSSQVALARPERQRALLDAFAGAEAIALRDDIGRLVDRREAIDAELHDIRTQARERAREADLLRHGLAEVEHVAPQPGEDESLAAEQARLTNADQLRAAAAQARAALAGDESDLEATNALALVASARQAVQSASSLAADPALADLSDRLAGAAYALTDVAADLSSYLADLDADPARLDAVLQRRSDLAHLYRRYGDDGAAVLAWAEEASQRLLTLSDDESRERSLTDEREAVQTDLTDAAVSLSALRRASGQRLAEAVTAELHALAMPGAAFAVQLSHRDDPDGVEIDGRSVLVSRSGIDRVEFVLRSHSSASPRPLGKGASGGELSRAMLAIEVVLAAADPVPTLVFDEVDAGVGGRAAVEVGRRLARLAQTAQVLVVTHVPQVAAFADRHVVVGKDTSGQVHASGVQVLDDAARAEELARMMAGLEASDVALEHARELLAAAATER